MVAPRARGRPGDRPRHRDDGGGRFLHPGLPGEARPLGRRVRRADVRVHRPRRRHRCHGRDAQRRARPARRLHGAAGLDERGGLAGGREAGRDHRAHHDPRRRRAVGRGHGEGLRPQAAGPCGTRADHGPPGALPRRAAHRRPAARAGRRTARPLEPQLVGTGPAGRREGLRDQCRRRAVVAFRPGGGHLPRGARDARPLRQARDGAPAAAGRRHQGAHVCRAHPEPRRVALVAGGAGRVAARAVGHGVRRGPRLHRDRAPRQGAEGVLDRGRPHPGGRGARGHRGNARRLHLPRHATSARTAPT